jgi:hypothetical protein
MINITLDSAVRVGIFEPGELVVAELQDRCSLISSTFEWIADECGKIEISGAELDGLPTGVYRINKNLSILWLG